MKSLLIPEFSLIVFKTSDEKDAYITAKLREAGFNLKKKVHTAKGYMGQGYVFTQR